MSLIHMVYNYNQMKGNIDKCHIMLNSQNSVHVNIDTVQIENRKIPKITGF